MSRQLGICSVPRTSPTPVTSNHSAPEKRPYGIDSGFRDPSGNSFRLTQIQLPAAV